MWIAKQEQYFEFKQWIFKETDRNITVFDGNKKIILHEFLKICYNTNGNVVTKLNF